MLSPRASLFGGLVCAIALTCCKTKPNDSQASAALAENAKAVCTPPIERVAPPNGIEMTEADAYAALTRIIAEEAKGCSESADAGPCESAMDRTASDVNMLRASLRSKHATLANVLRYPLIDAEPTPDPGGDPQINSKPKTRTIGIARFIKVLRVRLDHELSPRPSDEAIHVCTDLALFIRDVWRVGDLTAVISSGLGVPVLAAKCGATLNGSPPAERAALAGTLRELSDDTITFTSIMKNEWTESQLLSAGGLVPDAMLPCDAARSIARRVPTPQDADETQKLVGLYEEGARRIEANMKDPDHDESTQKYAEKLRDMKKDLAPLAAKAATPPRKRKDATPGVASYPAPVVSGMFNPKSVSGETIHAREDGTCFFKTIANAPSSAPSDPWRTIVVDCPSEMDDVAFDTCVGGTLSGKRGASKCDCQADGGGTTATPCPH